MNSKNKIWDESWSFQLKVPALIQSLESSELKRQRWRGLSAKQTGALITQCPRLPPPRQCSGYPNNNKLTEYFVTKLHHSIRPYSTYKCVYILVLMTVFRIMKVSLGGKRLKAGPSRPEAPCFDYIYVHMLVETVNTLCMLEYVIPRPATKGGWLSSPSPICSCPAWLIVRGLYGQLFTYCSVVHTPLNYD